MKSAWRLGVRRGGSGVSMLAALAGVSLVLGGCGLGRSSSVRPREANVKPLTVNDADYAKIGYRRDWTNFPYVTAGERITDFLITPRLIFVIESGSAVSALDASSGARVWSDVLATRLTKFISLRLGDYLGRPALFVSSEFAVFVLDPETGSLLTRQNYEKVVNTGPVVAGPILIYGTPSGEMLAHDLRANGKLWGFDLRGAVEFGPVPVGSAVAGVSRSGQLAVVDAGTGGAISMAKMFGGVECNPVMGDALLFVASVDQSLYAFDPASGREVWRKRTGSPLRSQPTPHNGVLYCTIDGQGLTAFDQATGAELWSNDQVTGSVIGMRRSNLLVWDGKRLSTISAADGSLFERIDLPEVTRVTPDKFVDGTLYLSARGGSMSKFLPRS
jgi:outer membrane protein assembly factor BamB